jgi:hypothetical protein
MSELAKTTVVNIKNINIADINNSKYKYIGRDYQYAIPGLVQSKYHNPYSLKEYGAKVPSLYISYLENNPDLLKSIKVDLAGFTLICHCKPQMCHGDLLAKIADSELTPLQCIAEIKKLFI